MIAEDGTTRRTYTLTVMSSCPGEERKILEMFYEQTQETCGKRARDGTLKTVLINWHGVRTDEDGEVISLRLEGNNLSGDIPSALLCLRET